MDDNSSATERGQGDGGPTPFRLTTVIPSDTEYLQFLAAVTKDFCRQAISRCSEIDEQIFFNIELVTTEAVVNAIRHAYRGSRGPVELDLHWADDRLSVRVVDYGLPFTDFDSYAAREIDELDPLSTSGRGIIIIRSLMDHLSYSCDPQTGRNVLEMVKSFSPGKAPGDK